MSKEWLCFDEVACVSHAEWRRLPANCGHAYDLDPIRGVCMDYGKSGGGGGVPVKAMKLSRLPFLNNRKKFQS